MEQSMNQFFNEFNQALGEEIFGWQSPEFPKSQTMTGTHCRLEPLDWDLHGADLFAANQTDSDNSNWTYMNYGPFPDMKAYRDWVIASAKSKDPQFYAIIDLKSNKAVGVSSYLRIDALNGNIEIGHLYFSSFLRSSIAATESLFLMMCRIFDLGYRRLEWKCNTLNTPSRNAAQRLGFSFEGIFRQATIVKGRSRDTAWYSIIDKDWPELKKEYYKWLDLNNFDEKGRQKLRLSELTFSHLKNIC